MTDTFDVYQYDAWNNNYALVGSVRAKDGPTACAACKLAHFMTGGLYYRAAQSDRQAARTLPAWAALNSDKSRLASRA